MAILGIDEVGRGPWAGPLVVGAVILPQANSTYPAWVLELTDSKHLSDAKRRRYAVQITKEAPASALGWVSAKELDELGLAAALRLATRRAVQQIQAVKTPFTQIIIDGKVNFLAQTPLAQYVTVLPKADLLVKEVSAASIIAKVARDQYMCDLAKLYPNYGFERHVGYGTAYHRQALAQFGPCPEHRFSFRPLIELGFRRDSAPRMPKSPSFPSVASPVAPSAVSSVAMPATPSVDSSANLISSKRLGDRAETVVADYLTTLGHQIVERNHKTSFYEIDIISACGFEAHDREQYGKYSHFNENNRDTHISSHLPCCTSDHISYSLPPFVSERASCRDAHNGRIFPLHRYPVCRGSHSFQPFYRQTP